MTIPVRMEVQANSRPTQSPSLYQALPLRTTIGRTFETSVHLSTADLAFRIFATFRAHPHINNVLTHISRSNWTQVERALNVILDPTATTDELSPLAHNIIDLMCAERGITGKILKPYFHAALHRLLGSVEAERLIRHIEALPPELERKAEQPAPATASCAPSKETA
ncbi:hypothetical protein [Bradyrhizobium sp.]|uniref:hypothetical protein n=1 Tax=Bradyrhizobium sp. TaxID=376 RepID=UPI0026379A85|nr:hypothetical protein [Bradyrhizobium sp.]